MLHLKIMRGFKGFFFSNSEGNMAGRTLGVHRERSLTLGKQPEMTFGVVLPTSREEIVKNVKVNKLCDL